MADQLVEAMRTELVKAKGWMKFVGIMMIIGGALYVLTIVGIIVAWLPIWMGVLLIQAAGLGEQFARSGDFEKLQLALAKLKTFFVLGGVSLIVGIALSVVWAIIALVVGIGEVMPFIHMGY